MSPGAGAYELAGEFYELVAQRQSASSGPPLRTALAGADPSAGPVLEVGAGTGAITEVVLDALPGGRVVAVEPAATMRAVLTARVAADPALRERVTITDEDTTALTARLDGGPAGPRFCAAVLFGVVGHLPAADRTRLWAALGRVLPAGAPVAVELMGTGDPRTLPATRMLRERIGEQVYEWWSAGRPAGRTSMRFDTAWRVLADGVLVREVTESYVWHTLDLDGLIAETGWSGRGNTGVDGTVVAVLRPD